MLGIHLGRRVVRERQRFTQIEMHIRVREQIHVHPLWLALATATELDAQIALRRISTGLTHPAPVPARNAAFNDGLPECLTYAPRDIPSGYGSKQTAEHFPQLYIHAAAAPVNHSTSLVVLTLAAD